MIQNALERSAPQRIESGINLLASSRILSQAKILNSYLKPRLSCALAETSLNIANVGIQLYDPFSIVDTMIRPSTRLKTARAISLRSKSNKSLLKRDQSMKGANTKSYRFIPTEIEADENDTRYYVFYDELSKSRSRRKLSPLNARRNRSPYSTNWNARVLHDSYNIKPRKKSSSRSTPKLAGNPVKPIKI
ncbi:unnamed protein product [Blepharisma stoltei]|uniref:Uncharacterized protein n=1 Tax=Blepharisma stoltei TaxID=1481888 RepID=A0AAU9JKS9_9CILI|nr:unnamed protein product [Blepharisma stoltei]